MFQHVRFNENLKNNVSHTKKFQKKLLTKVQKQKRLESSEKWIATPRMTGVQLFFQTKNNLILIDRIHGVPGWVKMIV